MTKQILISLTLAFTFLCFFNACTNSTEKASLQEPTVQTEVAAPLPKDSLARADSSATKGEKGEKEGKEDKDDDDEK